MENVVHDILENTSIGNDSGNDEDEDEDDDNGEDTNFKELEIKMNQIEQMTNIHIPVCNAFWDRYLQNGAGVILKFLIKLMFTESATSIRKEYLFLNEFVPKIGENYLDPIVKIKLFNEQFQAGKVDYDMDTLQTASRY